MRVDENVYKQMPEHLKRLFVKLPNPGSDEVVQGFPQTTSGSGHVRHKGNTSNGDSGYKSIAGSDVYWQGDSGSASRFFYCAKASKSERNMGLSDNEEVTVNDGRQKDIDNPFQRGITPRKNSHPTVKPIALMRYLCRLITPPDGTVLDPFAGSGSTLIAAKQEGFSYIGIEMEAEYIQIAECRLSVEVEKQETLF